MYHSIQYSTSNCFVNIMMSYAIMLCQHDDALRYHVCFFDVRHNAIIRCRHNEVTGRHHAYQHDDVMCVLCPSRIVNVMMLYHSINLSSVHKQEYATGISFLWARCAARCLHYIIQLQSAHCGKSNTALSLWFEMNFHT